MLALSKARHTTIWVSLEVTQCIMGICAFCSFFTSTHPAAACGRILIAGLNPNVQTSLSLCRLEDPTADDWSLQGLTSQVQRVYIWIQSRFQKINCRSNLDIGKVCTRKVCGLCFILFLQLTSGQMLSGIEKETILELKSIQQKGLCWNGLGWAYDIREEEICWMIPEKESDQWAGSAHQVHGHTDLEPDYCLKAGG